MNNRGCGPCSWFTETGDVGLTATSMLVSYLGDVVMGGHEARMSIARPLAGGERSAATNLIKSYLRRGPVAIG